MSLPIKSKIFCADYSDISKCLFSIQASEDRGLFTGDQALLDMLRLLESDALRRLLNRTVRVLGTLEHTDSTRIGGDYNGQDFSNRTFSVGFLLGGDFYEQDFYENDFFTGYLDTMNNSYSSAFQTVLNMFTEFCARSNEISPEDTAALNDALVYFLDAFERLQDYLSAAGLNPCTPAEKKYFNNSPLVYLQAAGADGSDGVPKGLHLRWSFNGELGNNHLAKGNYTQTTAGYNRADDFVHISRTPYTDPLRFTVNFEADRPVINQAERQWTYLLTIKAGDDTFSNKVRLTFQDGHLYNETATVFDPQNHSFDFLKNYNGLIELSVSGKTMFFVSLDLSNPSGGEGYLKMEGQCALISGSSELISVYESYTVAPGSNLSASMKAENMQSVRWKQSSGCFVRGLSFETYHDFVKSRAESDWTAVGGGFALSLEDQVVFDRLEDHAYPVDNRWPQYNNGTKVRVSNYRDKWSTTRADEPALKAAVLRYLELSESAPRAEDVLMPNIPDPLSPGMQISYLDILNMMATDYHIARMLGLGHIDTAVNGDREQAFVYRLTYRNRGSVTSQQLQDHIYISLPVSQADTLLPERPQIRPLRYGLSGPVTGGSRIFNERGYNSIDDVRAINIGREQDPVERGEDFFADLTQARQDNIFQHAKAIFYGIEYRASTDAAYVKPEITQEKLTGTVYNAYDDQFPDVGVPETVLVPDDEDTLFIHFNPNEGVQVYAIYGVNWFSRASAVSAEVQSDASAFPLRNTLKPPTDITVQYIQKEDTRIFTTAAEQDWLRKRNEVFPGQDTGFTRATFNWLDIADVSKLPDTDAATLSDRIIRPDHVSVHFKQDAILEIIGVITAVKPVPGEAGQVRVITGPYQSLDGTWITPQLDPADFARFADSLLQTEDGKFRVLSVIAGAPWPIITVEKLIETDTVEDPEDAGVYATQDTVLVPNVTSRFSLVENLSRPASWQALQEKIELVTFADAAAPVIESSVDQDGNSTRNWVGGITAATSITALFGAEPAESDLPGYYLVEFPQGINLLAHLQRNLPFDAAEPQKNAPGSLHSAHVEWYKGLIRIPRQNDPFDMKLLEVMRIEQTEPLMLFVFDPSYQEDPVMHSATPEQLVRANFHPGYRAYLFPEPAPSYSFNGLHILPSGEENDKRTFLGLQTVDERSGGTGFVSDVSPPVVLLARNIIEPLPFEAPVAGNYRVRPNETGRAAFTFDIKVPTVVSGNIRLPFGFRFYRTTDRDVLNALYKPATVDRILTDLSALTVDYHADQRAFELVNLIFDPADAGHFRVFEATPQPYGFPIPDHDGLPGPGVELSIRRQAYKNAIADSFLNLTEQPPVFKFIKVGLQTENARPVIKDLDGNLLDPADVRFDPFPMVRQFSKEEEQDKTYIRFTDYTLNGASRYRYFYGGAEINNQLQAGEASSLTGPVTVLKTMSSDAPAIRSYTLDLNGSDPDIPVKISFDVAPMSPEDHHCKLQVYRTADESATYSLSRMALVKEVNIDEDSTEGYEVTDDLSDLSGHTAGQTLFYRIAAVRTIINEDDLPEDVRSLGSGNIAVKLIDTVNPKAPDLSYDAATHTLHWTATANNGSYTVFKQNNRGNWQRLSTVAGKPAGTPLSYELPAPLVMSDTDGQRVYHRFKVKAENASGLRNLTDRELIV